MPAPLSISERDTRLLDALGFSVRALSVNQVARGFFDGDERYAKRRISRLVDANLLIHGSLLVRQSPEMNGPLARWEPGGYDPDFSNLSGRLVSRWRRLPLVETPLVSLGTRGARLVGATGCTAFRKPHQLSHDLALSEVFLQYRRLAPKIAARWVGEKAVRNLLSRDARSGCVIPDSAVLSSDGTLRLLIELGGMYSPKRLETLHESFSIQRISYELW